MFDALLALKYAYHGSFDATGSRIYAHGNRRTAISSARTILRGQLGRRGMTFLYVTERIQFTLARGRQGHRLNVPRARKTVVVLQR
jgi:hypothetical protein